jgi:hypothetical protein
MHAASAPRLVRMDFIAAKFHQAENNAPPSFVNFLPARKKFPLFGLVLEKWNEFPLRQNLSVAVFSAQKAKMRHAPKRVLRISPIDLRVNFPQLNAGF